ncbi:MAG: SHOCT domain-containing protein [Clostridiales bacterium]|nr:SHOCT domain-containing protein [Clostridiales bacterium]
MIWALVDFFLILADKLLPADGSGYKPIPVSVDNLASVKVLEKLAALHQQGVLTDEEFQQKKIELLSRI